MKSNQKRDKFQKFAIIFTQRKYRNIKCMYLYHRIIACTMFLYGRYLWFNSRSIKVTSFHFLLSKVYNKSFYLKNWWNEWLCKFQVYQTEPIRLLLGKEVNRIHTVSPRPRFYILHSPSVEKASLTCYHWQYDTVLYCDKLGTLHDDLRKLS